MFETIPDSGKTFKVDIPVASETTTRPGGFSIFDIQHLLLPGEKVPEDVSTASADDVEEGEEGTANVRSVEVRIEPSSEFTSFLSHFGYVAFGEEGGALTRNL